MTKYVIGNIRRYFTFYLASKRTNLNALEKKQKKSVTLWEGVTLCESVTLWGVTLGVRKFYFPNRKPTEHLIFRK